MLGPSLLAAICMALIFPDLLRAAEKAATAPYLLGLLFTAIFANLLENTGMAVLLPMFAYSVFLVIYPSL